MMTVDRRPWTVDGRLSTVGFAVVLMLVSGCFPIKGEDFAKLMAALAQDQASACGKADGWGGGGALTIAPAPIPGGAAGGGEMIFCRTNQPGSEISVTATEIRIKHGATSQKASAKPADREYSEEAVGK